MKRLMDMDRGNYIDIHTHILPGIDDGAGDWEECLEMLVRSAECGVSAVIATPHYIPWEDCTDARHLVELCRKAMEKLYEKHGISMDIYPGHEIYYSLEVIDKLKSGEALTLAGSRYVLVEFEPTVSYQLVYKAVKDFQDAHYIPILAHVERYQCLRKTGRLKELKALGALFQMNIRTVQRGFFDANTRWAKKSLRQGMIDFLASDMHNMTNRPPMTVENLTWVQKKLKTTYQRRLLCYNGRDILPDNL